MFKLFKRTILYCSAINVYLLEIMQYILYYYVCVVEMKHVKYSYAIVMNGLTNTIQ